MAQLRAREVTRFNQEKTRFDVADPVVRDYEKTLREKIISSIADPNIAFILFTIGFYGIVSELFHPNFFSGPVGIIALVLAFIGSNSLPLNIGGLLLILLGIGLFILELNVTSYGLLTIGGPVERGVEGREPDRVTGDR